MKLLKLSRWIAVLTLAIALAPSTASPQDADTLSISGTFSMDAVREYQGGTVGADLAAVFAQGNEHWWLLTLYGVTYSYDTYYYEWNDESGYGYANQWITRVHAKSFDFEFFGPDADVLNEVVSRQLIMSHRGDDVFLELRDGDYYDSVDPLGAGPYWEWSLGLVSLEAAGVSFSAGASWGNQFPTDADGYPSVEPQRVTSQQTTIGDFRPGNSGTLESYGDIVDIGSAGPPLPPPPPTPPTLSIADGAVREGNKGTIRLDLTVTLSRSSNEAVTVNYQTANGTALASNDYYSTGGTLTFQPSETSRTISIAIKVDRKREANETFIVQLASAVGATIEDAVGTATILNDD